MSMNWLSTLPAAGCVLFDGRRAYPFFASLCCEITHESVSHADDARPAVSRSTA
jgi:hypothetical protein